MGKIDDKKDKKNACEAIKEKKTMVRRRTKGLRRRRGSRERGKIIRKM